MRAKYADVSGRRKPLGELLRSILENSTAQRRQATSSSAARQAILCFRSPMHPSWATLVARAAQKRDDGLHWHRNPANVGLNSTFRSADGEPSSDPSSYNEHVG